MDHHLPGSSSYVSTDEASASPQSAFSDSEAGLPQKHNNGLDLSTESSSESFDDFFSAMDTETELKLEESFLEMAGSSIALPKPQAQLFARTFKEPGVDFDTEAEQEMKVQDAFNLLYQASNGVLNPNIPIRAHASPITPSENCFYVSAALSERKRKRVKKEQKPSICVKYQSFHNTEVWWSPNHNLCLGVVARAMSRKNRSQKNDSSDRKTISHGFKGRWFSLIRRENRQTDRLNTSVKTLLVPNVPSLVHFCTKSTSPGTGLGAGIGKGMNKGMRVDVKVEPGTERHSSSATGLGSVSGSGLDEAVAKQNLRVIKEDVQVEGDLVIEGRLAVNKLHVKGDLVVDGSISGQLVTRPGAADYAEWFAYLNKQECIEPGMVVQLRSPQQKITLDTSGEGPHMVVSTQPSVAAGVPKDSKQRGALCAFLGQVPVRVRGPVRCGDFLYPSGKNDGRAVPAKIMQVVGQPSQDPIGTAMMSCEAGDHVVLAFIRWQHNLKWQMAQRTGMELKNAVSNIASYWPYATFAWLVNVRYYMAERNKHLVRERRTLAYFTVLLAWTLAHLPSYHSFVFRDIYIVVPSLIIHIYGACRRLYAQLGKPTADGAQLFVWALNLATFSSFAYASIRLKIAATRFALESNSSSNWIFEAMVPHYNQLFLKFTEYLEEEDKNDPLFASTKGPLRYFSEMYMYVKQRILE